MACSLGRNHTMRSLLQRLSMLVLSVSVTLAPLFPATACTEWQRTAAEARQACCCGVAGRCTSMSCCGQQAPRDGSTTLGSRTVVPPLELAAANTFPCLGVRPAAKRFAHAELWLSSVPHTSTLLDQQVRLQL